MRKIICVILTRQSCINPFSNSFFLTDSPCLAEAVKFDTGDTAWMIVATALY
jgi:Amt family ammonium transporter